VRKRAVQYTTVVDVSQWREGQRDDDSIGLIVRFNMKMLVLVFILFIFIALEGTKSYNDAPHSDRLNQQVTIIKVLQHCHSVEYIHNHKLFK
jgi:hypothetical protein